MNYGLWKYRLRQKKLTTFASALPACGWVDDTLVDEIWTEIHGLQQLSNWCHKNVSSYCTTETAAVAAEHQPDPHPTLYNYIQLQPASYDNDLYTLSHQVKWWISLPNDSPQLIHGALAHSSPHLKRHLNLFSCFSTPQGYVQETDRHKKNRPRNISNNRPHHSCLFMQCSLKTRKWWVCCITRQWGKCWISLANASH